MAISKVTNAKGASSYTVVVNEPLHVTRGKLCVTGKQLKINDELH